MNVIIKSDVSNLYLCSRSSNSFYKYATSSPDRPANPATYLLISKALIAPEVVFGVGVGVGVPDVVDALEDVLDTVVVALTDEVTDAVTEVVIVRLDALLEEETTALLLLVGLEEVY